MGPHHRQPRQTVAAKPNWPSANLILPGVLHSQAISNTAEQSKDATGRNTPKTRDTINKTGGELAGQVESILDKFK